MHRGHPATCASIAVRTSAESDAFKVVHQQVDAGRARSSRSSLHPGELAQVAAQHQTRAVNALSHRGRLDAEHLGHVGRRHLLEVAQHERDPVRLRQPVDRGPRFLGEQPPIERARRRVAALCSSAGVPRWTPTASNPGRNASSDSAGCRARDAVAASARRWSRFGRATCRTATRRGTRRGDDRPAGRCPAARPCASASLPVSRQARR